MSCDPQTLANQAACLECGIAPGMQMPVLISLMCQIRDNGSAGGGGASAFTQLSDVPNTYLGAANELVSVNSAATGLVFIPNLFTLNASTGYVGALQTGNAPGALSLEVQSGRSNVAHVASGAKSSTFGYDNTASGAQSGAFGYVNAVTVATSFGIGRNNSVGGTATLSSAFGQGNAVNGTATTQNSSFGTNNTVSVGTNNSAFGNANTASGVAKCSAFGYKNTASGTGNGLSSAFGYLNTASKQAASSFGYKNTNSSSVSGSAFGANNAITTTGNGACAFGNKNQVTGTVVNTIAFGYYNACSGQSANCFGQSNSATALQANCFGTSNTASATNCSAFGVSCTASTGNSTAVGLSTQALAQGASAFGYQAVNRITLTTVICGAIMNRKDNSEAVGTAFNNWCGVDVVLSTQNISFTATSTQTITIPTGAHFYPNAVGVIVSAFNTVTIQPTIEFGITGSNAALKAAAITTNLTANRSAEYFTVLLTNAGQQTLTGTITVAATATTLTGRFYFRGLLIEDN